MRRRANSSTSAPLIRLAGAASGVSSAPAPSGPVRWTTGFAGAARTGTPVIPASAAARWTACALVSGRPAPGLRAGVRGGTRTERPGGGPPGASSGAGAGGPAESGTTGRASRCTGTAASAARGAAGGCGRTTGTARAPRAVGAAAGTPGAADGGPGRAAWTWGSGAAGPAGAGGAVAVRWTAGGEAGACARAGAGEAVACCRGAPGSRPGAGDAVGDWRRVRVSAGAGAAVERWTTGPGAGPERVEGPAPVRPEPEAGVPRSRSWFRLGRPGPEAGVGAGSRGAGPVPASGCGRSRRQVAATTGRGAEPPAVGIGAAENPSAEPVLTVSPRFGSRVRARWTRGAGARTPGPWAAARGRSTGRMRTGGGGVAAADPVRVPAEPPGAVAR